MVKFVQRMAHGLRAMNMSFGLILSAIILPNAAMHLAAWVASTPRGFYVLDYVIFALLIEAAAATRTRVFLIPLATMALFIATAGELMQHLGNVFLFDLRQVVNYLDFVNEWPLGLVIGGLLIFTGYLALVVWLSLRSSGRSARSSAVFSLPGIIFCLALPILFLVGERALDGYGRPNLAEIKVGQTAYMVLRILDDPEAEPFGEPTMHTAITTATDLPNHILSIPFESLGALNEGTEDYLSLITRRFNRLLADDYEVSMEVRRFTGSTLTAEIRELCSLKMTGAADKLFAMQISPQCLPQFLNDRGYVTHAAHGYYAQFYNRHEIYPALAFDAFHTRQKMEASDKLAALSQGLGLAAYCDGLRYFKGPCDAPITAYVLGEMKNDEKSFGHVMTKDLHFPFPRFSNKTITCTTGRMAEIADYCAYVKFAELLFFEIGTAIANAERKPDLIFIYGDHRPHTENPVLRDVFSQTHVPVITLRRKSTN